MNEPGEIPLSKPWRRQIACALEGYAGLAAAHKQAQQALCLTSFCNELQRSIHMPLSPIDRTLFERAMISVWQALDEKSTSEAQVQDRT